MPVGDCQTAPGLAFEAEAHRYYLDGERLPGVTSILKRMDLCGDTSHWKPEHAERGTLVHRCVHALVEDDLNWSAVPEHIKSYVDGFEAFRRDSGWSPLLVEQPLASRTGRFAGTMDQLGVFGRAMTLIDIKSGSGGYARWHALQLAAYDILIRENAKALGLKREDMPERHYILQLTKDGKYRLHEPDIPMATARALFLGAVQLYCWKGLNEHDDEQNGRC